MKTSPTIVSPAASPRDTSVLVIAGAVAIAATLWLAGVIATLNWGFAHGEPWQALAAVIGVHVVCGAAFVLLGMVTLAVPASHAPAQSIRLE